MPIFGDSSTPYDEFVEKVTAETLTEEKWEWMIDICDRVNADGAKACKQCLLSVKKRLNHRDPHVVLLALSLLDCLWNNCGQKFRREISSKEFIGELNYKCTNSNRVVGEKARLLVKKWSENECKQDSSLSLVESLYKELLEQGYSFDIDPTLKKKKTMFSNDPNVVATDQEEADIAKAIALSLQESGKKQQINQNAYPLLTGTDTSLSKTSASTVQQSVKQVRALYVFEAVEDNEISFSTGDIITVYDDSDQNWWRGSNGRGATGLFPASFVTSDLFDRTAQITTQEEDKATKVDAENINSTPKVQIDENILLKCIELIEGLDPSLDASSDPPELAFLENMSISQAPLIDQKLMQIDKQLNLLAEVDLSIRDVLGSYDSAVQQVSAVSTSSQVTQEQSHVSLASQPSLIAGQMTQEQQQMTTSSSTNSISTLQQQLPMTQQMVAQWQQQQQ